MSSETSYMLAKMLEATSSYAVPVNVNGVNFAAKTGTTNYDDKAMSAHNMPYSAVNDLWTIGYNTEYSGMRFALFYLSEYGMLFANSLLISILFLGGYLSPFGKYVSSLIIVSIWDNYIKKYIVISRSRFFYVSSQLLNFTHYDIQRTRNTSQARD